MTDAPETRKTHITRLLGTNKNGDVLQHIWVDLERIEATKSATKDADGFWQGVQRKFLWSDDPDNGDEYSEEGTPSRNTDVVKVCSPDEEDVNNPEEFVKIRVIKSLKSSGGDGRGQNYMDRLLNDELSAARVVKARRIVHYDTNIDDEAQAAFDADPTRKAFVVPGHRYEKDTNTKDDDQYVEHEIIEYFKSRVANNSVDDGADVRNGLQTKLFNQYLIDGSDEAELDVTGENGINPPYRLDPYQNIVNVNFSSPQEAVLGVGPHVVDPDTITEISKDGSDWELGFGSGATAASGLGFTVAASTNTMVVFGKPRDGDACFIAINITSGIEVRRGVPDGHGGLAWATVATLPATDVFRPRTVSFAGGAFFISYTLMDNATNSFLAASFDGRAFTLGINAFSSVPGGDPDYGGATPAPVGGGVAYNPKTKIYVTTGYFTRAYRFDIFPDVSGPPHTSFASDSNFMWATSSSGLTWIAGYDVSQAGGGGGPSAMSGQAIGSVGGLPSVCFGAGLFVAATYFKLPITDTIGGYPLTLLVSACAIATSPDGQTWTNRRLPGSSAAGRIFGVSALVGTGECIGFFKTSGSDANGPKGFFVTAGYESQSSLANFHLVDRAKLWTSSDGVTWELVRSVDHSFDWILSAINKRRGTVVRI